MKNRLHKIYKRLIKSTGYEKLTKDKQKIPALVVIVAVVAFGAYILSGIHAASPNSTAQASSGILANGACLSSNGQSVVFNGSSPCAVSTAPLATWLKGEGTTYSSPGFIAADSTANGHDGLINDATWVSGDPADTDDSNGDALAFNGTTSYVDVPTAVDLALSRTISATLDVNFSVNPGSQTQTLFQKDPGDGSVSPYGVQVLPATSSTCQASDCASIGLYWAGQWLQSSPVSWTTEAWYTIQVVDNGTTISFARGSSTASLTQISSMPDPTGGTGTQSSSGSLYLGRGPANAEDPLAGDLQDVKLGVPLTVAPSVSGEDLSSMQVPIGNLLTVTANVTGAWGNPNDPYLPQPDISDELNNVTPVKMDLNDPGSITATAVITLPDSSVIKVPGFLNQNFTNGSNGLVPTGSPTWTFRYTPRVSGSYSVSIAVTTFNGSQPSSSTTAPMSFTATQAPSSYQGFVQIDNTNGDQKGYYQYSQSRDSFFAVGADLNVPELTEASHTSAENGLLGGSTVGSNANGETSQGLAAVYQEYLSDLNNLASVGANSGRLRLDSRFLPLELCPAGNWTTACSYDLQPTARSGGSGDAGLVGYSDGVMPSPGEIFTSGAQTPNYFGTFAIGRYNDANAWIADQIVAQAQQDGIALQLTAWNADLDYGGSCYADANEIAACKSSDNQNLIEQRLYYDEARWGYSSGVLSWEYFNELPGSTSLSSFWTGTSSVSGINSFLDSYNMNGADMDSHLITSSCSTPGKNSYCDPVDQVESHVYESSTPSSTALQLAYLGLVPHCISGMPCLISETGMSNDSPVDPNSWSVHKGLWAALTNMYSGDWYWWVEEGLNSSVNTKADPGSATPIAQATNQATWDPESGTINSNAYTVYTGISAFLKQWPGTGASNPDGLDSYSWDSITAQGSEVTGDTLTTDGLVVDGMVGKSTTNGSVNALVWLVNNDSTGGDPSTDGYSVVPASTVTVTSGSSTNGFKAGAQYLVQWWDTTTGHQVSGMSSTVTASASGAISLNTPAISTDMAATITAIE